MEVRCPSCSTPIELSQDTASGDVTCPSCDSQFNFLGDATVKSDFSGGSLGRFEIQDKLGAGAFGTVWKALDTELDRTIALKVPHEQRLSTDAAESFLREARAAAQLKHPGIVGIHEIGRVDDKTFIVCDLIQGVTLADRLSAGRLPVQETVQLSMSIAEALEAAHQAGVIHRDLKPSNVMLDEQNNPFVMDFGLAKREQGEVTVTEDGRILGTPAYMSPEQARGSGHSADGRSDIYSLGVMLFEMLTGEKPFRGSVRMLLHQVLNDDPPSPRTLNNTIPVDLETICLKCLEKDPDRRYRSAEFLKADLQRFQSGEPVNARPVSSLERLRRYSVRKPAIAGSIVTIGLLLVAIASLASYSYFNEKDLRTKAETATEDANRSRKQAVAALRKTQAAEAKAEQLLIVSQESEKKAVAALEVAEVAEAKAVDEARNAEEQRRIVQRQFDAAVNGLRVIIEDAELKLLTLQGTHAARITLLNIAIDHMQEIRKSGGNQPEISYVEGLAYHRLGYVKGQLSGDKTSTERQYRKESYAAYIAAEPLLGAAANSFPEDKDIRMQHYYNAVRLINMEGNLGMKAAVEKRVSDVVERAVRVSRDFSEDSETKHAHIFARSFAGDALTNIGSLKQGLQILTEALELLPNIEEVPSSEQNSIEFNSMVLHERLRRVYADLHRWDESIQHGKTALVLANKHLAAYSSNYQRRNSALDAHYNLATTYYRAGRYPDAYLAYEEHRKFYDRYWPDGNLNNEAKVYFAYSAFRAGENEASEKAFLEVETSLRKQFESTDSLPSKQYVTVLLHLIDLYAAWDKPEDVAKWKEKSEELK